MSLSCGLRRAVKAAKLEKETNEREETRKEGELELIGKLLLQTLQLLKNPKLTWRWIQSKVGR